MVTPYKHRKQFEALASELRAVYEARQARQEAIDAVIVELDVWYTHGKIAAELLIELDHNLPVALVNSFVRLGTPADADAFVHAYRRIVERALEPLGPNDIIPHILLLMFDRATSNDAVTYPVAAHALEDVTRKVIDGKLKWNDAYNIAEFRSLLRHDAELKLLFLNYAFAASSSSLALTANVPRGLSAERILADDLQRFLEALLNNLLLTRLTALRRNRPVELKITGTAPQGSFEYTFTVHPASLIFAE